MPTIFTLNSRSNVMLEVIRDHFRITAPRMYQEIQRLHKNLLEILESKNIKYENLRAALAPVMDRREAAFIFDSTAFDSDLYGREAFMYVLPLLEPKATQSILVGDMIGEDQHLIVEIIRESMVLSRSFTFKHSTLLYCVYINNLSDTAIHRLHQGLANCPAYLGHIPTTFGSRAKTYVSLCVCSFILKNGKTLIVAHEDDRDNSENINITLYPLEEFGYRVASLQGRYFSIFLGFKIERPSHKGFQVDTELALNSISDEITLFYDFDVLLDEKKYGYLINEKLGKLKKAGLDSADREYISSLIQSQLSANYIYNLSYLEEYDVMKFNIMLEVPHPTGHPTRMTAALEYIPAKKILRIITLH
ncbi:TPA: hypothetical protein JAJ28_004482 [Aeromonas hydrophila]|uniref:Uncharacterized protein n=2 Tax=Aeromonas hydrophila TaxID=644 RepID=A0AAD3UEW7_AERHY|nr:hypothetical protein [Aeromonas hydrophila]